MIQVFYCFGLLGSYPMQLMPVFEIVEGAEVYKRIPTLDSFKPTKRMFFRTILVLLTATGAIIVPKFGLFINLIGSFACTALAFILPVRMYNKTHESDLSSRRRYLHLVLMVFGCVCGAISFVISVVEIVKAFSSNDPISEQIAHPEENAEITQIDLNAPLTNQGFQPKAGGLKF